MKRMIGLLMVMGLVVGFGGCGDNPLASGEWKNSSECGGFTEGEVRELWNEVEKSGGSWEDYDAEAQLNREHGQLARARKLDCQAWLARNR